MAAAQGNVVLTGFMGTGKSTIARRLAGRLDAELVDTDSLIVERHGPIPRIFAEQGEPEFRRIERELAAELAGRRGLVIATGGRMLVDPDNAAVLELTGRVFCLTASVDTIVGRVAPDGTARDRPMLAGGEVRDQVERLLAERASAYARFEQVATDDRSPDEICDEIVALLERDAVAADRSTIVGVQPREYRNGDVTIAYDEIGPADGFPVLLIAPGGMRSAAALWDNMPWNPIAALGGEYRVIAMDQRNAGRSSAPVSPTDGWPTYRDDQLGLLDHLGIDRCHVIGMCIGGPYVVGLLTESPERFASAVLLQPVGVDDNRALLEEMFDRWVELIGEAHPEASPDDWAAFRTNMWGGEFVLTATREQVAAIPTPMLLLMGNDEFHPQSTSREIAAIAPNVEFVERWKDEESLPATDATIKRFLADHTP